MARGGVRVTVDKRSVRSFSKNLNALANVVSDDMANAAVEFGEEVLADSNSRISVDTGTAASSAGIRLEGAYKGARARFGYAVSSDPTNPRTGEPASLYLTTLHEDLSVPHANGQAKFFETALIKRTETFHSKGRDRLAARLSGSTVNTSASTPIRHIDYLSPALSRVASGFTATKAKGRYLPFPARIS